jgi:hypothetical protein
VARFLEDRYAFWAVEIVLYAGVTFASFMDFWIRWGMPGAKAEIKRGDISMARFGYIYTGITALAVLLPLQVEEACWYRTVLAVGNAAAAAYLCFFNGWFRNKLMGWIASVATKIER